MGKAALQLYSVREAAEKDFLGTVRKVADMGYDAIQFAGYFNTPAHELKSVLDEKGITVAGSHIMFDAFKGVQLIETFKYNREIGNDLLIIPAIAPQYRDSEDAWKRTAEEFNKIGQACKEEGFTFAYHNHSFEFEKFGDSTGFDLLFGNSDPDLVKIELDCYWATFADLDPLNIINNYGDRVVSLHLKDMTVENGEKRSIEIGSGSLDIESLLNVGTKNNVRWFIIEQEKFDGDPMESSKVNIENLKKLMNK
ncbi:sugar phosphate isomerase/epimerase family protein [Lederbergia panacisoli]|uniref:sugar phosphate isomerase/epimerase family protein n=1 Tax=Lederbergia panacisoli TaxID=1255251 RepID=UPI00214AA583|nr:sugar phosphate isomerase/epimerase [Lederbergia panacisoli]MCR2820924.1 sugar phosphate isomerase/epimerase [Lederbergia panacisoli]